MMFFRVFIALSLVVGVCADCVAQRPLGPDPPTAEYVLVLHNREIVRGAMFREAGYWVILPAAGGRIRIADRTVDAACRSIDEAYRHLAAGVSRESVPQQLELARWCLRNRLLDRAARHVMRVRQLDPDNPGADWLERNIVAANVPRRDSSLASTGPQAEPKPKPERAVRTPTGPLPPRSIEMFTTTIQPILMNRCATAACHGSSRTPTDFRMMRPLPGQPIRQATTQRNLASVLDVIDRDRPSTSPLLTAGHGPHARLERAVFDTSSEQQFVKLRAWVGYVTATEMGTIAPKKAPEAKASGLVQQPKEPAGQSAIELGRVLAEAGLSGRGAAADSPVGAASPEPAGRDPFDPDLFNRRYGAERPSTATRPDDQSARN